MAELLIYAQDHWMDSLTEEQKEELRSKMKNFDVTFARRYQRGNIVCRRPDGWKWGKKECPPKFVVLKLPGAAEEDVDEYLESEYEDDPISGGKRIKLKRKFMFNPTAVSLACAAKQSITLSRLDFVSQVIDRTLP